jgi:hypothetical protein
MRKTTKKPTLDERTPKGAIEWIAAREMPPIQNELLRLRAHMEATRLW